MKKVCNCTGDNLESIKVGEAIVLAESLIDGLRGGNVAFCMEYEKDDVGTKLVIRTYRENPIATVSDSQSEPSPVPSGEKVARSGRRKRSTETVEGVAEQAVNESEETAKETAGDE